MNDQIKKEALVELPDGWIQWTTRDLILMIGPTPEVVPRMGLWVSSSECLSFRIVERLDNFGKTEVVKRMMALAVHQITKRRSTDFDGFWREVCLQSKRIEEGMCLSPVDVQVEVRINSGVRVSRYLM